VPIEPGLALLDGVELDRPAGVLAADEDVDEDVALCVDVVPGLDDPPVAAIAMPATPPPSPAATTAVMTRRRMRPELVDPIGLSPFVRGPAAAGPGAGPRMACAPLPISLYGGSMPEPR
jgi:hypothetical protein